MKNKKHIIVAFIFTVSFVFLTLSFWFFKSIIVFQPFSISISDITINEANTIKIYGITPLNRELKISYDESNNEWESNADIFLKKIEILIPDTVEKKVNSIIIRIDTNIFSLKIRELIAVDLKGVEHKYYLPLYVKTDVTVGKIIPLISKWPIVIVFFNTILIIGLVVFLLLIFFRLKDKNPTRKLRLLALIYKVKIKNGFSHNLILWIKIISISVIIACSIFYGYLLIRFTIASWITSILFILFVLLIIWIIINIIYKILKTSDSIKTKTKKGIIIAFLVLLLVESLLRIFGVNKSYNESIGSYYSSGFIEPQPNDNRNPHLWIHKKNEISTPNRPEFNYEIKTNSDGLRDIDHPLKKQGDEYRIICLGNSFTEGVGTPEDSTWPKLLENRLKSRTQKKITVFNAGCAGSDPFFEYALLEEKMLKYEPDIVFVALGNTDIGFYRLRGGFERFTKDGFNFRPVPKLEKIYAASFIFRFFTNAILGHENFLLKSDFDLQTISALNDIKKCVYKFHELSMIKKFKLVIMFYDDRGDEYFTLIKELKDEKIVTVFDLFDYNDKVEKVLSNDKQKYFWPIDGHCNPKGYDLISKGVEWNLINTGIIDSTTTKINLK